MTQSVQRSPKRNTRELQLPRVSLCWLVLLLSHSPSSHLQNWFARIPAITENINCNTQSMPFTSLHSGGPSSKASISQFPTQINNKSQQGIAVSLGVQRARGTGGHAGPPLRSILQTVIKMCVAFHVNGRPHLLTLRYRVTGFNAHQGIERYESSFRFLFSREKEPAGGPP